MNIFSKLGFIKIFEIFKNWADSRALKSLALKLKLPFA